VRADASQVFDLDGVRLAALARSRGLPVSVAATPAAPPRELRPWRLLQKQRAGADVCIINHAGGPETVHEFVAACRAVGVALPFLACVAVFTDAGSAAVLEGFPGLVLEHDERRRVLDSADPREAGIDAAVVQARQMLAIPGVVGVNLSGSATIGPEDESAAIMAEVARRLRAPS
jgi:5,10-methylenetetrahydrofolate reductase